MTKARDIANIGTALTTVSATELGYLDGTTSAIQTQLNAKQPTVANVSDTEIGYLDGVTSAIQTQLNAKATTADIVSTAGGSTITVASGTTVPLTIQNNGTGNSLVINDAASDTSPFTIAAEGKVSIGNSTNPTGQTLTSQSLVVSTDEGVGVQLVARKSFDGGNAPNILLMKSRGTAASPTAVAAGDNIGGLQFSAYDGTNYINAAAITSALDATPGANDMPTSLRFLTTPDGSATATERMRIDNAGNIYIGGVAALTGLSTTRKYLSITGPTDNGNIALSNTTASSPVTGIVEFHDVQNTASSGTRDAYIAGFQEGSTANNKGSLLSFATKADGVSGQGTEQMRINNAGNVGIGTASPAAKLDVNGDARFSNQSYGGKNVVCNGGLDFWQRGTTFAPLNSGAYAADRWSITSSGTGINTTVTQDTATPNASIKYAIKYQQVSGASSGVGEWRARQFIETSMVRPLQGRTVTSSMWYKSNLTGNHAMRLGIFNATGSGLDSLVTFNYPTANVWQYVTLNHACLAGTTGWSSAENAAGAFLDIGPTQSTYAANDYFEFTNVQVEAGSVATTFSRAAGTYQGELALCQRYYWRRTGQYGSFAQGQPSATTTAYMTVNFPVPMRAVPTAFDVTGTVLIIWGAGSYSTISAYGFSNSDTLGGSLVVTTSGLTLNQPVYLAPSNAGSIGYSAEL